VISHSSEKLIDNLYGDKDKQEYAYADYAIILCDEREHVKLSYEVLFMGHLVDSNERWAFYKAYDFEFPSTEELKHLKAIILPGSFHGVYEDWNTWIEPLKKLINTVYYEYPHIRMAGICFGH
jgi:GMP synthase-like glutamine amidotransferase